MTISRYVLSFIIVLCLMVNSANALTKTQAKAIMSNITAVVALNAQKPALPLPTPVTPDDSGAKPDSGTKPAQKSGCASGNCPTSGYESGRFRLFNR